MTDEPKKETVTLLELMVVGNDRCCGKAGDREGVFTDAEFNAKLDTERANYLAVLKRLQDPVSNNNGGKG